MNKTITCFLLIVSLCAATAGAQNLADNEYQKTGREYEQQAKVAMEAGDYAKAAELADLATEQYRKSREAAEAQGFKFRAANAINLAQQTITDIGNNGPVAKAHARELTTAKGLLADARALFAAESWIESRDKALQSLDALKGIKGVAVPPAEGSSGGVSITLPRYYTVVSRPVNTDCFWNIAKMGAIYDDPLLWPNLWNANKDKMRDPENPNLIYPGMVLEIPPIGNEKREGTFDPEKTYPALEQ